MVFIIAETGLLKGLREDVKGLRREDVEGLRKGDVARRVGGDILRRVGGDIPCDIPRDIPCDIPCRVGTLFLSAIFTIFRREETRREDASKGEDGGEVTSEMFTSDLVLEESLTVASARVNLRGLKVYPLSILSALYDSSFELNS